MTSLFSYSPDDLEELQFLFLNYVNQDFPECTCGCRGFPINILTLEFNEIEVDLNAYSACPARYNRKQLEAYKDFKKDPLYISFLEKIYPERYGGRRPSEKKLNQQKERELAKLYSAKRAQARNEGSATFSGRPCINGHSGKRSVKNNECVECRKFNRSLRDAIQRGAFRERLTRDEKNKVSKIYAQSRELTKQTGVEHHVDHIKPLSAGGRHHPSNLQILTAKENLAKGAKYNNKNQTYSKREKEEFLKTYSDKHKQKGSQKVKPSLTKKPENKSFLKSLFKW